MVSSMNKDLAMANLTTLCVDRQLDDSAEVELTAWEPHQKTGVYKATFTTLPGGGKFWGYAQVNARTTALI